MNNAAYIGGSRTVISLASLEQYELHLLHSESCPMLLQFFPQYLGQQHIQ